MIIWLASYPKSGNTWIRSFLTSLLFSEDGKSDLSKIKQISQYPLREHFNSLVKNIDDLNQLAENWIASQDLINLDNKIKFIKTHHVNCNIGGNSFTNYENTFGVIYIVRDPRNVITSVMNHFSKKNIFEAKEFLFDEHKIIGRNLDDKNKKNFENKEILTFISSWKTHYISWKNTTKNFLLIRYENLVAEPEKEFNKIINYLSEKLELKFSKEKFINAIKSNSFDNLKKQEETVGFSESPKDKLTGETKKFFHLGPNNDWKKLLENNVVEEIQNKFENEMKELGYL